MAASFLEDRLEEVLKYMLAITLSEQVSECITFPDLLNFSPDSKLFKEFLQFLDNQLTIVVGMTVDQHVILMHDLHKKVIVAITYFLDHNVCLEAKVNGTIDGTALVETEKLLLFVRSELEAHLTNFFAVQTSMFFSNNNDITGTIS